MTVYSRVGSTYQSGGSFTTGSAALDGAAAPAGSLLVAIVFSRGALASNSWNATAVPNSGNNGSLNYLHVFSKPSDGATKDFTVTTAAGVSALTVIILELAGFVSATLDSGVNGNPPSGSSLTLAQTAPTVAAKTVTIAAITLASSSGGWSAPTDGFEVIPTAADTVALFAIRANTAAGALPSMSVTWTTARAGRAAMFTFQGITVPVVVPSEPSGYKRGSKLVRFYRGTKRVHLYRGTKRIG